MDYVSCVGLPARTMVAFAATGDAAGENPLELKSLAQQELLKRGILWGGFHNLCLAHTDADVDYTLASWRAVLEIVKARGRRAPGRGPRSGASPVEPVFRKTSHFHTKPVAR